MKHSSNFKKGAALIAAAVLATSLLAVGANAHSVDKAQSLTIPIPQTPGAEVTFLGQKFFLPRNMSGQAVLTYQVKGQTSDLIVSEAVAADDCTAPQTPFIGVDIVGAGGTFTGQLQVTGTAVDATGQSTPYDSGVLGGSRTLGNAGETTEVLSICTDL